MSNPNCKHFALLLFLLLPFFTVGQSGLFLDLGLNSAKLTEEDTKSRGRKSGFYAGLHYAEVYENGFEFGSNVQYSAKGNKFLFGGDVQTYKYLDAMATVGYRPVDIITIFGGGTVGRLLGNDDLFIERDLDLGLVAGLKVNFEKGYIKAHYNRGLINQTPSSLFSASYNANIQIGAGLKIDFRPVEKLADTIIVSTANPLNSNIASATESSEILKQDTSKNYQVGVRLSGFDRFDMIYKVETSKNRYIRWGLFTSNVNYTFDDIDRYTLQIGMSVGSEYHKQLDEKTYFAHGPQFLLAARYRGGGFSDIVDFTPGFGYLLGIYHQATDRISIGLEIQPSLTYSTQIGGGNSTNSQSNLDISFGTANAGLVIAYRFQKKKLK